MYTFTNVFFFLVFFFSQKSVPIFTLLLILTNVSQIVFSAVKVSILSTIYALNWKKIRGGQEKMTQLYSTKSENLCGWSIFLNNTKDL